MSEEIINKVKDSGLINLDLAKFKPTESIIGIDLAERLWQGLVLKEKDFRQWIKDHDWSQYRGAAVYIFCSEDALIPTWAYMLVASALDGIAVFYSVGNRIDLEKQLIRSNILKEALDPYVDGRIIIKGCSDISVPDFAMVTLIERLQPIAKSIMYGEPCSTVPVFKRKG